MLVDTRDEHLAAVVRPDQTSHTLNILKSRQSDVTCFRCGGPNHLARDCMQRSSVREIKYTLSSLKQNWASYEELFEKRKRGQKINATLSPFKLKEAFPVIKVVVNGKRRMALVDSGCSRSLVTELVCNPWNGQASDVLTVDGKTLRSNGIETITLAADNVSSVKADVLVVNNSLSGFDMQFSMDIIRMLGGVRIDQSSNVIFSRTGPHACAAIRIEEPDFSAEFNEKTRAWTASWKWSGNQPPNSLLNKVPEYPVSAQVQQEYRHEPEM